MTRSQCEETLKAYAPLLNECFTAAWTRWRDWLSTMAGSPGDVSALTRAMALHDFIRAEVHARLAGKPGVRIRTTRSLMLVRIHDRVVIRFKKFRSRSLKTSGNPNQQTIAFDSHQLELPTGSLQPITHLVAGYLLDDLEASIEKVAITCLVDGEHFWDPIEILAGTSGHTATVHKTEIADPTVSKPRVRSTRRKKDVEGG